MEVYLILFFGICAQLGHGAVLEATIQIESDNIHISSFLERFKLFIAKSHITEDMFDGYIQSNNTFQANYDFSQNLLTMDTNYSLIVNTSDDAIVKISDIQITVSFRLQQDSNEKIVLEDLHGDTMPKIGFREQYKDQSAQTIQLEPEDCKQTYEPDQPNLIVILFNTLLNFVELIVVTFIHIVINGVLSHALTSAFQHLYHGQLS